MVRLNSRKVFCFIVLIATLVIAEPGHASWNLSVDGDARYQWLEDEGHEARLHLFGASLRKTLSDKRGDRFIFFGLLEAEDNFSEVMLHEIYGQYKGPLGAWNVTAGRFGLPWGLLPGFSASRLLYDMPHDNLLGMDVDSGLKVSGILGAFDYGISVTQGYGPHHTPHDMGHGLGVARLAYTPGDTEEFTIGVSAAWGRSVMAHESDENDHDEDRAVRRALGGVDVTLYLGRWLGRMEIACGRVDHRSMSAVFTALDYALLPRLDMNLAVNVTWMDSEYKDKWFVGFTGKPPWFNIRGGYCYEGHSASRHQFTLQLYRLFSFYF